MYLVTPHSFLLVADDTSTPGAAEEGLFDVSAAQARLPSPAMAQFYIRISDLAPDADPGTSLSRASRPLDGVLLAGGNGRARIEQLSGRLAVHEARAGLAQGATKIIAVIDTPAGALAAPQLPGCSARLAGLVFDGAALADRLGPAALAAARGMSLLAAAVGGIEAIDGPQRLSGAAFAAACEAARAEGFAGKAALDAAQAEIVAAVFGGPSIDKPPLSGP